MSGLEMFPAPALLDVADSGGRDPEHICDLALHQFTGFTQPPDFSHIAFREFGHTVPLTKDMLRCPFAQSSFYGVVDILLDRHPLKVLKAIIGLVPVLVVALVLRCWGWADERFKDKPVNHLSSWLAAKVPVYLHVPPAVAVRLYELRAVNPRGTMPLNPVTTNIQKLALGGDSVVSLSSRNPFPSFSHMIASFWRVVYYTMIDCANPHWVVAS